MNNAATLAILALFATSLIVRVLPVLLRFELAPSWKVYVEQAVPSAVFINFVVYIFYSELAQEPLAATISLAIVATVALLTSMGLLISALIAAVSYYSLVYFMPF
ncbi:AzlD domain-containing protein [Marinobacter sp. HL-58]|uniref:AzlD domain-containing protein n=1 Tax=Marinobacter sp. HL-58 TaxID=1479237 RepID=UPI0004817C0B|nr:AzlD domain-containing protein [Marinobacter sp. HL-58]KPP98747.1 MAG: Branched-chain amino acid transport protein (AzlD) [Marinobacter sp. HL-58]